MRSSDRLKYLKEGLTVFLVQKTQYCRNVISPQTDVQIQSNTNQNPQDFQGKLKKNEQVGYETYVNTYKFGLPCWLRQ